MNLTRLQLSAGYLHEKSRLQKNGSKQLKLCQSQKSMVNEHLFAFFLLLFSVDLHVKIQTQIEIWAFTLIFAIDLISAF